MNVRHSEPSTDRHHVWIIAGFTVFLITMAALLTIQYVYPQRQSVQQRASIIINAIEQYRVDYRVYPRQLSDLIPTYLSAIPQPAWNKEFLYSSCSDEDIFLLNYRTEIFVFNIRWHGWSSRTRQWKCMEGDFPVYLAEYPCFGYVDTPQSIPPTC
jgi:hypothetical protein